MKAYIFIKSVVDFIIALLMLIILFLYFDTNGYYNKTGFFGSGLFRQRRIGRDCKSL